MLTYIVRRLLLAIPTLLFIAACIFLLLNLAPNDPMAQVPMTIPPDVKEKMREALGLGQPLHVQFLKWVIQFFGSNLKFLLITSSTHHFLKANSGYSVGKLEVQ